VAELRDELRRRDLGVGVLGDPRELLPVDPAVEPKAEPAPVTDVGRAEEVLRTRLDERFLRAGRLRHPRGEAAVAVVVVDEHQVLPARIEERRRAVRDLLVRVGQGQADLPHAIQCPHGLRIHLAA
jgi:hypothetical protein